MRFPGEALNQNSQVNRCGDNDRGKNTRDPESLACVSGWTVLLGELENSRGDVSSHEVTGHSSAPDRDYPLNKLQGPAPLPHPQSSSKAVRTIKLDPLDYPNLIRGNKQFAAETFKTQHVFRTMRKSILCSNFRGQQYLLHHRHSPTGREGISVCCKVLFS